MIVEGGQGTHRNILPLNYSHWNYKVPPHVPRPDSATPYYPNRTSKVSPVGGDVRGLETVSYMKQPGVTPFQVHPPTGIVLPWNRGGPWGRVLRR